MNWKGGESFVMQTLSNASDSGDNFSPCITLNFSSRAKLQLMLHKPKEALEDVLKVLKWRSSDFEGLCVHAEIFHQLGQFEKSLLVWHRVKKIRPRCNLVRRSSLSCLGCCSLETSSEAKASKQFLRC